MTPGSDDEITASPGGDFDNDDSDDSNLDITASPGGDDDNDDGDRDDDDENDDSGTRSLNQINSCYATIVLFSLFLSLIIQV